MGANRRQHRSPRWPSRRDFGDDGITLVEVIVAFTVLLITILPLTFLLTSVVSSAANSRQKQAALQLADSWLEVLSNSSLPTNSAGAIVTNTPTDPTTIVSASHTQIPKSTLAGTAFAVTANFTSQSVQNHGQSDLCSSGQPPSPSHPAVIILQVTVSWNHGNNSVTDTTAVNYPQPGLQTQGFLAVQLTNAGGLDALGNVASDRLQAVPVSLTETAQGNASDPWVSTSHTLTLYPDEQGCVFAQVPVGTYTVAAAQAVSGTPSTFTGYGGSPPFVTPAGLSTDSLTSQSVTVTNETIVQLNPFDEGLNTSIAYGTSGAVDDGVSCPGTSILTCVTTGNGPTGATAAQGGGSTWNATQYSSVTNLSQVACTSGTTPVCVGVGYGSGGGAIITTSSGLANATPDTVPAGVTDITSVTCPSAKGCYAIGISAAVGATPAGPVLLAGAVGQTSPQIDTWVKIAPLLTTFTGLSSLACPTTSPTPTCEVTGSATIGVAPSAPVVLRLDGDPAGVATNPLWAPTYSSDVLPTTVKSVGRITCPTTTLCEALAVGDSTGPSDPTILTVPVATSGASTWVAEPHFPSGAAGLTGISCTSTTCLAIGSIPGATPTAAVWTGDLTTAPHNWVAASTFPSTTVISSVACGQPASGDDADCVLTATPSTTSAAGQLIEGSLGTNGAWVWNPVTIPTSATVRYYFGAACESSPSSSRSTCAAVGATPNGPIVVDTTSGPLGTWKVETPASFAGAAVTGIPLETAPASTTAWSTQVPAAFGVANVTTLPVLYPQPNGYSIAAGDCLAEGTNAWAQGSLSGVPGGTASVTVPLGLLALQLVTVNGAPVSGATLTLTSTTCGAGGDRYVLPVTDAYGVLRTSVPYGTYSYSVTVGGVTTNPTTTVTVAANSVSTSTGSTVYLPTTVAVTST